MAKTRVRAESKGAVGAAIAFSLLVAGGALWMESMGDGGAYEFSTSRFGRWFSQTGEHPAPEQVNKGWPLWATLAQQRGELVGEARWSKPDRLEINGHRIQLAGVEAAPGAKTCVQEHAANRCGLDAYDILDREIGRDGLVACKTTGTLVQGAVLAHCHADGRSLAGALLRQGLGRAVEKELSGAAVVEGFARRDRLGIWR